MKLKEGYLIAYNAVLLFLWARSLAALAVSYISDTSDICGAAAAGMRWARYGQALSCVEVVHTAVGLAGGGVTAAVIQALGRGVVLFAVLPYVTSVPCGVTGTLVLVWAVGDIFRYTFYISTILKTNIYILLWVRYSAFLVLYPVGMAAEWLCYYLSLHQVRETGLHRISLPNTWNFSFDFAIWNTAVLASYAYFAPYMYLYMVKQRRRKLGPPAGTAAPSGRARGD